VLLAAGTDDPVEGVWLATRRPGGAALLLGRTGADGRFAARGLVNRRFVPIYFDLYPDAPPFDELARKTVVRHRPALGREEVTVTGGMPVLVMAPNGSKVVEELGSWFSPEEFHAALREVLRENARYDRPSEEEQAIEDPLARVDDPSLADRARVERAWLLAGRGDVEGARAVWRALVEQHPQGPRIDRADWVDLTARRLAAGEHPARVDYLKPDTLLGRAGYAGAGNPDLLREDRGRGC